MLILLVIANLFYFSVNGQELKYWTCPNNTVNSKIAFTSSPPTLSALPTGIGPLYYDNHQAQWTHNIMYDENNNLLFFIVDNDIYDNNGKLQGHLEYNYIPNDPTDFSIGQEVCIVQVPGQCFQYYIFYSLLGNSDASATFMYGYTLIDISQVNNWDQGDVQLYPTSGTGLRSSAVHFALSTYNATLNQRYLYVEHGDFQDNQNSLEKYTITTSGITHSQILIQARGLSLQFLRAEMETFRYGSYNLLAYFWKASTGSYYCTLNILDPNNGDIQSLTDYGSFLIPGVPKGMEFSPKGRYLYFTYVGQTTINYVDLQGVTPPANLTIHSLTNLGSDIASNYDKTMIENGYDGKMYFASSAGYISCLDNADYPLTTIWHQNYINTSVPLCCSSYTQDGHSLAIRVLPDQIDGEAYWSNISPVCCSAYHYYDPTPTVRAGTSTWTPASNPIHAGNSLVYLNNTLILPTGSNITIQDMTIEFGEQGKIELDGNAHLTLDNSTVKGLSSCNTMWLGIDIVNNGYVSTLNNSAIKEAIIGISNDAQSNLNGEICCYAGTTFLNNQTSIYSHSAVRTRCYSATFNANSSYNNLTHPYKIGNTITQFVNLDVSWMTSNVSYFGNCTFSKDPSVTVTNGILSINSNYQVYAGTFSSIPTGINSYDDNINVNSCNFSTNTYGIYYIAETNPNTNLTAENSTFQDDWCSIYLSGSDYDYIYLNSFNPAGNSPTTNFYGIYNNGATYYGIYDNTFNYIKYGIFDYKGKNGKIKNYTASVGNSFTNCYRGIQTSDDNTGTPIKCNTFTNNTSSLSVHWYIGGALSNQGSNILDPPYYTNPAGNEFYQLTNYRSILSTSGFIYYHHHNSACTPSLPLGFTSTDIYVNKTQYSCPGETGGGGGQMSIGGISAQLSNALTTQNSKEGLIDDAVEYYTINQKTDSITPFLESYNTIDHTKWLLIPSYIQSKNFIKASALLNNISVRTNNKIDTDKVYKKELYSILLNWGLNNKTAFNMSAGDQASIRQMAQIKTQAGINAQNILHLVFGDEFPYTWVKDSVNTNARLAETGPAINDTTSEYLSAPFPNPTNSETNFKYFVPEYVNNAEFDIFDVTGRNIKTIQLVKGDGAIIIHAADLNTGIYFCELIFNKVIIDKKKIVIFK